MTAPTATTRSRRERLRDELVADIKTTAVAQLEVGGPQAVTLRGIARELGVSPAALYGYVDSLDDLFTAIIVDGFHALAAEVEAAIGAHGAEPAQDRLLAGLFAYRRWALEHSQLFRLLYFSPLPDYVAPHDGPTVEANLRVCAMFLVVLVEAWATGVLPPPPPGLPVDCSKFNEHFGLDIGADQLRTSVGAWAEFHGFVSLEVNGHVDGGWVDPAELYDSAMRSMLVRFGFAPASADIRP